MSIFGLLLCLLGLCVIKVYGSLHDNIHHDWAAVVIDHCPPDSDDNCSQQPTIDNAPASAMVIRSVYPENNADEDLVVVEEHSGDAKTKGILQVKPTSDVGEEDDTARDLRNLGGEEVQTVTITQRFYAIRIGDNASETLMEPWRRFVLNILSDMMSRRRLQQQQQRDLQLRRRLPAVAIVEESIAVNSMGPCPAFFHIPCQEMQGEYELVIGENEDSEEIRIMFSDATLSGIKDGTFATLASNMYPESTFTILPSSFGGAYLNSVEEEEDGVDKEDPTNIAEGTSQEPEESTDTTNIAEGIGQEPEAEEPEAEEPEVQEPEAEEPEAEEPEAEEPEAEEPEAEEPEAEEPEAEEPEAEEPEAEEPEAQEPEAQEPETIAEAIAPSEILVRAMSTSVDESFQTDEDWEVSISFQEQTSQLDTNVQIYLKAYIRYTLVSTVPIRASACPRIVDIEAYDSTGGIGNILSSWTVCKGGSLEFFELIVGDYADGTSTYECNYQAFDYEIRSFLSSSMTCEDINMFPNSHVTPPP